MSVLEYIDWIEKHGGLIHIRVLRLIPSIVGIHLVLSLLNLNTLHLEERKGRKWPQPRLPIHKIFGYQKELLPGVGKLRPQGLFSCLGPPKPSRLVPSAQVIAARSRPAAAPFVWERLHPPASSDVMTDFRTRLDCRPDFSL